MATTKLILVTKTPKKDGTFPLKIQIGHKTKSTFIPTGIYLLKEQFNGIEIVGHKKRSEYNRVIASKKYAIDQVIEKITFSGEIKNMDISDIRKLIEQPEKQPEGILAENKPLLADMFRRYIEICNKPRTKEIYEETLKKVERYRFGLLMDDVSFSWLREFDLHLAKTCSTNTRAIHFRNIRAIFNYAIDEEIIGQNSYPFRKFKIKTEQTPKRALTIDQIKTIIDYPVQEHQKKYRDLFMLSFYLIGINAIDLLNLTKENIVNGRIEYRREKTGTFYSIELLAEAKEIIERYAGEKHLIDVMDAYKDHRNFIPRWNENLKELGKLDWVMNKAREKKFRKKNVKKITPLFPNISTYYARHSWATIAAGLDIPKETIAAALGHQFGNKITTIYIDFDRKKVDAANRLILETLKK